MRAKRKQGGDATLSLFDAAPIELQKKATPSVISGLRIGTSAFTANGWAGTFYPVGMKQTDYLTYYATQFDTVEIDSTYYRTPTISTVQGWHSKTPEEFVFVAKVPQVITHEKVLKDAAEDFRYFLTTMDHLKEKLGALLFQFPYFNKKAFPGVKEFLARLVPFMRKLPKDHKFAVEIRNRNWLTPEFVEALRSYNVALALIDHPWFPRPTEMFEMLDPITSDFTYIRLLGDRKAIEKMTMVWDKTIIDRTKELTEWVEIVKRVHKRKIQILAFANNHYAGNSISTVSAFLKLLAK